MIFGDYKLNAGHGRFEVLVVVQMIQHWTMVSHMQRICLKHI